MKRFFLLTTYLLVNFQANATCDVKDPNDILNLIKENHPRITLNTAKSQALLKSVEVAGQRPNPEFDAESKVGDSLSGNVYTTSLSIKHRFETSGKRASRIKVAKNMIATRLEYSNYENEQVIVSSILKLYRLRQLYDLIPLYQESLNAFNKILRSLKSRRSLSPEQQVESETLSLASNDYKLKISQLKSEQVNLNNRISFFMGTNCLIPLSALPRKVNLSDKFEEKIELKKYSKLRAAKSAIKLAQANLGLEQANSYPDINIGPTYEYERVNIGQTNSVGVALTMDLPIFNINSGGRAKAAKKILIARINARNIEKESQLDRTAWITKYNQYKSSLKTIANKKSLERKHIRIENLFKRGIISTSLVIESHRQLIEFSTTRYEFERAAIEALWNIHKINGTINTKQL